MKRTIGIYDPSVPLVSPKSGTANAAFNIWVKQVTDRGLFIGTGSPESVVEAQQGAEYLDITGSIGVVKYIKQDANIAGDRTKGWVIVANIGDAVLGGQSGGQTLNGDTVSGGDLILQSTYHATKGSVYIGDHANGNELVVEADGTLRFDGTATVWRDEMNELIGKKLESPASDITIDETSSSLLFDDDSEVADYVMMNVQLNHDWKVGSSIYPHLHWRQGAAAYPNWLIQWRWQIQGQEESASWWYKKVASHQFTWSAGTLNQISSFGAITAPVGAGISDIVQFRLIRDCSDTSTLYGGADPLAGDASAVNFDVHIECDTIGSRSEFSK